MNDFYDKRPAITANNVHNYILMHWLHVALSFDQTGAECLTPQLRASAIGILAPYLRP
jgi:hypothetical protein